MRKRGIGTWKRYLQLLAVAGTAVAGAGLSAAGARGGVARRIRAPAQLEVQPFPGTSDASPRTQIAFPALAPRQIKAITVSGSLSGPHRGRFVVLQARHGTAFMPSRPFTDGDE